jgi:LysM repeat protein
MTRKSARIFLFALGLGLTACFRPAGDPIEPTTNVQPLQAEQPASQPTPNVISGTLTPLPTIEGATDEADVEASATPAPTETDETDAMVDDAADADAMAAEDDEDTPTRPFALTVIPPATSTSASDAGTAAAETRAASPPTTPVTFVTPSVPRAFTQDDGSDSMSAFTDATEEPGSSGGLDTPTAFIIDPDDPSCTYVVESGDSLNRIAIINNFTEAEMREANPGLVGQDPILQIGQELRLPFCGVRPTEVDEEPVATAAPTFTHLPGQQQETYRVQSGDTLTVIANRFGVSVQAIVDANELTNPDRLDVGQELIIPSS